MTPPFVIAEDASHLYPGASEGRCASLLAFPNGKHVTVFANGELLSFSDPYADCRATGHSKLALVDRDARTSGRSVYGSPQRPRLVPFSSLAS